MADENENKAVTVTENTVEDGAQETANPVGGSPRTSVLGRFFLHGAIALAITTAIWWPFADWFAKPAAFIAGIALEKMVFQVKQTTLEPGLLKVETFIRVQVPLPAHVANRNAIAVAPVLAAVKPARYGYGLPLLVALLIAGSRRRLLKHCVIGGILMVPVHAFAIMMNALKELAYHVNPAVVSQMNFLLWEQEFIALGFQISNFFVPTLIPIAIWFWIEREYVMKTLLR